MKERFKVKYLPEAVEFLDSLPEKVRDKITYNVEKCKILQDSELFCKLNDADIWEFRTRFEGNIYRLYAFWDTRIEAFVVVTHGVQKKWQKADQRDIDKTKKEVLSNDDYSYLYN